MDIAYCIEKLIPGAKYGGSVTANTQAAYDAIRWNDERTKPTWTEMEAVWPEVEAELVTAQKRQAYKSEADPLYAEWQALLSAGHEDAEARRQEWIAKRAEIAARFE